eukprot:7399408-Pyramimonas_sp.AAC.1
MHSCSRIPVARLVAPALQMVTESGDAAEWSSAPTAQQHARSLALSLFYLAKRITAGDLSSAHEERYTDSVKKVVAPLMGAARQLR